MSTLRENSIEIIKYDHAMHKDMADTFNCGQVEFNEYIQQNKTKQNEIIHLIKEVDSENIMAYFSVCSSAIVIQDIYAPAIEIKMFAVNNEYQGKVIEEIDEEIIKYSDVLFCNSISFINEFVNNYCGARYVVVYSVPYAENFYSRNGFSNFSEFMDRSKDRYLKGCIPMYLDIDE